MLKLLTIQTKNAATAHYKDIMLFRLYDKEYGIVPAVNDFRYEFEKSLKIVQHGPISSFQSNLSRQGKKATLSPANVRKVCYKQNGAFKRLKKTGKR